MFVDLSGFLWSLGPTLGTVLVTFTGALFADSFPPDGVEVALIFPSGKLFLGCTVAYPSFPATASPISTSLLS